MLGAVPSDVHHVSHLPQVSSRLRHPWYRSYREHDGAKGSARQGLGMVAVSCLAIFLGLDRGTLYPVALSQDPGYTWLALADHRMLHIWVRLLTDALITWLTSQAACDPNVADRSLCSRHGTRQQLLRSTSMVRSLSTQSFTPLLILGHRICLSIMAIEIFSIFLPCYQVLKHRTLQQETLDAIALWESRTKQEGGTISDYSGSTRVAPSVLGDPYKKSPAAEAALDDRASTHTTRAESIFTMEAMEHTLKQNPEPLRKFSALRDFSGENVAFITNLWEWKSSWPMSETRSDRRSRHGDAKTGELSRRELFKRAVRIYANFVSHDYADFPVNISSRELKLLDRLFEDAARTLYGDSRKSSFSSVTPFDEKPPGLPSSSASGSEEMMSQPEGEIDLVDLIHEKVQYWGEIPEDFDAHVFDEAEKSVKYLMLTNTWPKFIKEKCERQSMESTPSRKSSRYLKAFSLKGKL